MFFTSKQINYGAPKIETIIPTGHSIGGMMTRPNVSADNCNKVPKIAVSGSSFACLALINLLAICGAIRPKNVMPPPTPAHATEISNKRPHSFSVHQLQWQSSHLSAKHPILWMYKSLKVSMRPTTVITPLQKSDPSPRSSRITEINAFTKLFGSHFHPEDDQVRTECCINSYAYQ